MSLDSLSSGKGTPWGPSRYGDPTTPVAPTYKTDANAYQSFDTTKQFQQGLSDINKSQQAQINRAKMQAAAKGGNTDLIGRSLQGQREQNMNQLMNSVNQASWADKQSQMARENDFNKTMYALLQNQYKTDAELAQGERANRQKSMASILGPLGNMGSLFGGY